MKKCKILNCGLPQDEADRHGLCLMHSYNPNKSKDAFQSMINKKIEANDYDFTGYFFPMINFKQITFYNANFSEAIFFDRVYFEEANFYGNTIFTCSIFLDNVNFSDAIFNGYTDFRFVTFAEKSDFNSTQYNGDTLFLLTSFLGYSSFGFSTFKANVNFEYVTFMEFVYFRGSRIFDKLTFNSINFAFYKTVNCEAFINSFKGDFSIQNISTRGILRFEHSFVGGIRFEDTDLKIVQFYDVTWDKYWCRNAIRDELTIRESANTKLSNSLKQSSYMADVLKEEHFAISSQKWRTLGFGYVEKLYRELKYNYENQGDYKNAGDFHYGEMEMHRCDSKWRYFPTWYNFYRCLSGYGERPMRAFIWLLLLIPTWSGLLWWLGISQSNSQTSVSYVNTLFFILEKALLQRPAWPEGINNLGKILGSVSVLLIPGQAALFLLALRNRLGRRR